MILSDDISLSSAVLIELLNRGVCTQFLNDKYLPSGLLAPYVGHHLLRRRFVAQLEISRVQQDRLWQKVVCRKIHNQAMALAILGADVSILKKFESEVEIGDLKNHEAQAARYYWKAIFGDEFRRNTEKDGLNSFLNYGYAVLRSAVARYVVASGLNPSIGIFHKNFENPFCLVDDLMEPFRPLVDYICVPFKADLQFSIEIKKNLVNCLEHIVIYNGERKPLRNAIQAYCQSFAKAILEFDYKKFDVNLDLNYEAAKRV